MPTPLVRPRARALARALCAGAALSLSSPALAGIIIEYRPTPTAAWITRAADLVVRPGTAYDATLATPAAGTYRVRVADPTRESINFIRVTGAAPGTPLTIIVGSAT
ncbi:MAG: hypothetical protein K2Q20_06465, partial [Phycisphaerales bacterium]|nr:hypothetical protein [Phycisphaerales bacterium]